jgi:hypothetical protein
MVKSTEFSKPLTTLKVAEIESVPPFMSGQEAQYGSSVYVSARAMAADTRKTAGNKSRTVNPWERRTDRMTNMVLSP